MSENKKKKLTSAALKGVTAAGIALGGVSVITCLLYTSSNKTINFKNVFIFISIIQLKKNYNRLNCNKSLLLFKKKSGCFGQNLP